MLIMNVTMRAHASEKLVYRKREAAKGVACGTSDVTGTSDFRRRFMDNQAKVSLACISCYLVS